MAGGAVSLQALARALGIAIDWRDAQGRSCRVADDTLEAIVTALGYPAGCDADVRRSLDRLMEEKRRLPALITVEAGTALELPRAAAGAGEALLVGEGGTETALAIEDGKLRAVVEPGYYRLVIGGQEMGLAVAPRACPAADALLTGRPWGPAVQIPALRDGEPRAFGTLGQLAHAAQAFACRGADCVAISPLHALYPSDGGRFSPYAPSSRQFLNAALADPALLGLPALPAGPEPELIAWQSAIPAQHRALAEASRSLGDAQREEMLAWARECGEPLQRHALFDALHLAFAADGAARWQDWPRAFHDPEGDAARQFARNRPEAVAVHVFGQWLAAKGLECVQARARAAGMALGLVADLAVGVDPGGSDSWSMGDALLQGLTIGAPPDPLGPDGQNWGLTAFSPEGLRRRGFAPWLAMARAALGPCGGLRIDHAFGLCRLWVIPEGASALDGAYLAYPFADLLRLLALESHRAEALIIGEDLGTMPPGFREAISSRNVLGMRVLWFERDHRGRFRAPEEYEEASVAMTGTHDTPTIAGWWRGRDIDWAWKLGRSSAATSKAADEANREADRSRLWAAVGNGQEQPSAQDPRPAVDAAVRHVARSKARLALFPLEDLLGLEEQPNLPGTTDEHPNWRRRLPRPLGEMLDDPPTAERIALIGKERSG